jgi:hypothetical protein
VRPAGVASLAKRLAAAFAFLVALSVSLPTHAGVYWLIGGFQNGAYLNGATATQTSPQAASSTNTIASVQSATGGPSTNQAFQVVAQNASGGPSCTVQFLGSNDGLTFTNIGSTVAASSQQGGSNAVSANTTAQAPFQYFAAIVTAISGTGTKCFASVSG